MTETTTTRRPYGDVRFIRASKLEPGMVVWPLAWAGDTDDQGRQNEWCIVAGHTLSMQLKHRVTGTTRWLHRIPARWPHDTEATFRLDAEGQETVRVIVPFKFTAPQRRLLQRISDGETVRVSATLAALMRRGVVELTDGTYRLTDAGRAALTQDGAS